MLNYNQAIEAVKEAETTLRNGDIMLMKMIPILTQRLESIEYSYSSKLWLKHLKRKLANFNSKTLEFKK